MNAVTPLVNDIVEASHERPSNQLLPLVYQELRRAAAHRMAQQPHGHTLQPTALVHEAFLRLTVKAEQNWSDRHHFFAAASEAMRHILIDRARKKAAVRNGGGLSAVLLEEDGLGAEITSDRLLQLDEALSKLAEHDAEAAELVKLRFFGGFNFVEAAELLHVSERNAKRLWSYARAWLAKEMQVTSVRR